MRVLVREEVISNMKSYELFLIFSMNLSEEDRDNLISKFCDIVKSDGQVDNVDKWGRRRFAYPIQKQHEGFYVILSFQSGSKVPAEITRVAGITDGILRNLLVVKEKEE